MSSPLPSQGTSEKLTRDNFLLWETQVLPAIRGARLMGFLDGTNKAPADKITVDDSDGKGRTEVSNPEYENWVQTDQQVLHYLLASLSKEILVSCIGMRTASAVWLAIKTMFAAKSRTRIANLRVQLANTKKEGKTTAQYFAAVKAITDELAAAGRPMEEDEVVEYLLAGLDDPYNPLFAAIGANPDNKVTVPELYAQLSSYDNHMKLLINNDEPKSSVNSAARGRGARHGGRGNYRGRGGGRGHVQGHGQGHQQQHQGGRGGGRRGGRGGGRDRDVVTCQICGKTGHSAYRCWHRYSEDDGEEEEERGANAASYGVDTNWYSDTGATDHITSELDKLTMKEKYHGRDKINAANGAERKHRHIVEVGLALLAQASMPLKFWDEAFLTATYLINIIGICSGRICVYLHRRDRGIGRRHVACPFGIPKRWPFTRRHVQEDRCVDPTAWSSSCSTHAGTTDQVGQQQVCWATGPDADSRIFCGGSDYTHSCTACLPNQITNWK
ncbi:hypothetical protein QYE76_063996 [Lolium multiflorum]|uniref:CCHC-type domain-containing protein n=1 Tax=Lolium multiflorum TaxID=4521 RepID=A0AAD8S5N1_LOLMU|nr:hypothetical protein QYE76_063996 [Lolium multiflorum]